MPNAFDLLVESIRLVVREELARQLNGRHTEAPAQSDWLRASELQTVYKLPAAWFMARGREGLIERAKHGKYVLFNRRDVERFLELAKKHGGENAGTSGRDVES